MAEYNNLKIEKDGATAVLSIARPNALNALNSETIGELNTALTEIEADDSIKVLIVDPTRRTILISPSLPALISRRCTTSPLPRQEPSVCGQQSPSSNS